MISSLAQKRQLLGFTLVEVLLALSVFSLAGLALLSTADTNFRSLSHIENKMVANWVASNQLVEVNLSKAWPPKNNQKGTTELAGREWYWSQQVVKTLDSNMRSVTVEVRFKEKDELPITSMTTFVAQEAQ